MLETVVLETPSLGDRSYFVTDGDAAVVFDPQRDIDRVLHAARIRGVEITHVFETHVHNDYVSGGAALARATRAAYCVAANEDMQLPHQPVHDGDRITTGGISVDAVATPGHTPHHLSYVVRDGASTVAAFTGGSLLHGAVGRTDLFGTDVAAELARLQFRSAHQLAALLPDDAVVYPTHGFGSFCAAAAPRNTGATMADQRGAHPALTTAEDDFVAALLDGYGAYPRYYENIAPLNRRGLDEFAFPRPHRAGANELRCRLRSGEWVVDTRPRRDFAADHLAGSVNIELGGQFATTMGWILPWNSAFSLLAESPGHLATARLDLSRVGIERLAATQFGALDDFAEDLERRSYRVASFDDLDHDGPRCVIDVRRPDETRDGTLPAALAIPFWELPARVDDLPLGEIWVYCASGFRAAVAASVIDRAGRDVVLVDDFYMSGPLTGASPPNASHGDSSP